MKLYLLPIVAALFALWLLEVSPASKRRASVELAKPPATRLLIYWIDSLADIEAENPQLMPNLQRRMASQPVLRGPAQACADAVTVPCFTAMITGVDRFSMFSLGRNFGPQTGALEGSVLRELQSRGHRVGYAGEPMFEHVVAGVDYKYIRTIPDTQAIAEGLEQLDRERLDLLIVHLRETDEISHRFGPSHSSYKEGLRNVDAAIDAAFAQLRPTDHLMIIGDHGHTPDGRHFAGLEVPTYAALFGPSVQSSLRIPMAVSDFGHIWAHLFGVGFGPRSFVDDYFAGAVVKVPAQLPVPPGGAPAPLWAAAACLLLGALLGGGTELPGLLGLRTTRGVVTSLLLIAAFALVGSTFTTWRPLLAFRPLSAGLLLFLATGLLVLAIVTAAGRGRVNAVTPLELGTFGITLFALPTVYKYGGAFSILSALIVIVGVVAFGALQRGNRRHALLTLALLVPLYALYNPAVRNFAVRWFPVFSEWIPSYAALACVVFGAGALAIPGHESIRRQTWLAAAAGAIFAGLTSVLSPYAFVLPCALAMPLCFVAMRRPSLAPVAIGLAVPALWFFNERDAIVLGPVSATMLLWAYLPLAARASSARLRGFVLVALVVATFWASMGCRMTGISFNFFFAWLPAGVSVTQPWVLQTLFTLAKYALAPALGLLLAHLNCADEVAEASLICASTARARLGLTIIFLSAFSFATRDAGPFLRADITQEVVLWVFVLAVIAGVPSPKAIAPMQQIAAA